MHSDVCVPTLFHFISFHFAPCQGVVHAQWGGVVPSLARGEHEKAIDVVRGPTGRRGRPIAVML